MQKFYTTHKPVRFPLGITMNEKLFRRFGADVPVGSVLLGLDGDRLHFLVPDVRGIGAQATETFKFISVREYGSFETKDVTKLRYIGRTSDSKTDIFQEVA